MLATRRRNTVESLADVPALILAGGLGTRLRAAVPALPKPLAPIHGRPFLSYVLDRLAEASLRRVVLLTGYQADAVENAMGERHGPLRIDYSREMEPLGTGGALRQALDLTPNATLLVLNGDSWCDIDLERMFDVHRQRRAALSMAVVHVEDAAPFGQVHVDRRGRVSGFAEKSTTGPGWINAGIYLLSRGLIETMPAEGACSLEREYLSRWIETRRVFAWRCPGPFIDIGTPESYRRAGAFFNQPAALARAV